jgi:hypothetical protein
MKACVVIANAVALVPVTAGCMKETQASEPVRPVLSVVFEPTTSDSIVAVGTIEPRYKTDLGFRLLGV